MMKTQRLFLLQLSFVVLSFIFTAQLLSLSGQQSSLYTASLLHEENTALSIRNVILNQYPPLR